MPRISSTTKIAEPEYSYDFPMPSSSSLVAPSLPTRKPAHVLRRPRSPSPSHHTYHVPHFPSPSHATKHIPSTRAAEVSRLLDPSYSNTHPQGSGSSSSNSPLSVFVDHYGDLHDPEYRHFPAVVKRPKWEQADEDEDDEEQLDNVRPARQPTYRPSYAYTYQYEMPKPSPSSYESQLPSEESEESPFTDESEKKEHKSSVWKARRHSKSSHVEEKEAMTTEAPHEEATEASEYVPSSYAEHDYTPTCTESIRREWQAITLSLRFSVFRTKRKLKRRIG